MKNLNDIFTIFRKNGYELIQLCDMEYMSAEMKAILGYETKFTEQIVSIYVDSLCVQLSFQKEQRSEAKSKETQFTEKESEVIKAIATQDEFFNGMAAMCFEDIKDTVNLTAPQLQSIISSLDKKGVLINGEYPNGLPAYHLVNEFNSNI